MIYSIYSIEKHVANDCKQFKIYNKEQTYILIEKKRKKKLSKNQIDIQFKMNDSKNSINMVMIKIIKN